MHKAGSRIRREIIRRRLRGDRFECPLCLGKFKEMLPSRGSYYVRGELVDHYTANSICPGCGSIIRHRFLFTFLQQEMPTWPAGMAVMHFAPEPALYGFFKSRPGLVYVPCDLAPDPRLGIEKVDITSTGLAKDRFDLIVCSHVLEHIVEDRQAIGELYRVLKPGGRALIAVPIYGPVTYEDPTLDFAGRVKMYGIGAHVRLNGLDLKDKLEEAGFQVRVVETKEVPGNYMDHQASSPHIETDKYLFWCRKPEVP